MEIVFGVLEICVNYPPVKGGGLVTGPVALDRTFEVLLRFLPIFFSESWLSLHRGVIDCTP